MSDIWKLMQYEVEATSRRLRGMAMLSRGIVPNLVVSQRVVDRVHRAAQQHLEDETGETMVGLVVDGDETDPESMPTLYVLDTITPDESTVRQSHMFVQGDELQGEIFIWQLENWQTYRDLGHDNEGNPLDPKWDVPLRHLGDWHKQPGFMIQPSSGDLMTALQIMDDPENGFEFLLVPIVTLGHPPTTLENDSQVNYHTVKMPDGSNLRMDWWYIHRDVRMFQPIKPEIAPEDDLPKLTPYPWHLLNETRLWDEMDRLNENGLFVLGTPVLWESDGDIPLEYCLMVGVQGSTAVIQLITDWNYPEAAPKARLVRAAQIDPRMYAYDIFAQLWDESEVVEIPGWTWSSDQYLDDYVRALAKHLELVPATSEVLKPASTVTTIPVEMDETKTTKDIDSEIEEKPHSEIESTDEPVAQDTGDSDASGKTDSSKEEQTQ